MSDIGLPRLEAENARLNDRELRMTGPLCAQSLRLKVLFKVFSDSALTCVCKRFKDWGRPHGADERSESKRGHLRVIERVRFYAAVGNRGV